MFRQNRSFAGSRIAIILALIIGLIGVTPAEAGGVLASEDSALSIHIQTPSTPVHINSGESKLVPLSISGAENFSGTITSRTHQFFTQYDVPLSQPFGPFAVSVRTDSSGTANWNELVYLPKAVADKARSTKDYAIVLKTTFTGSLSTGERFSADSSLLLLLPPDNFSKVSPADLALVPSNGQSLQWNASVGAVDYEYCFDTFNNNVCDSNWTGTYSANALLPNLPQGTIFYWQVRANNTTGTTYANNGDWWAFTTASSPLHMVTKTADTDDGVCDSDCSLREAVSVAVNGDTIIFDPVLSGQRVLSTQIILNKDLIIDGTGLDPSVIISTEEDVVANVFKILDGATVTLQNLKITSSLDSAVYVSSTLIVNRVTFQGNRASSLGGAIYMEGGTVTVTNSTFTENHAPNGGAIFSHIGNLTVKNSTFSANSAGFPGLAGFGSDIYNHTGILHLHNSILANSTGGSNCFTNTNSRPASYINNIIERPSISQYPCGSSSLEIDPMLGPLADNGGTTETMALLFGSPAIDAGDNATCAVTDQRGVTRPQGDSCDIGAFEQDGQIYFVKWDATGEDNGSSWANAYTELQSALAAASAGDQILVAAGTYKPTAGTDRSISFVLKNGVALYGGFAGTETLLSQRNYQTNVTVLSGDIGVLGDASDNSYHVVVGSDTSNSATLDGFTVTGGHANGSDSNDNGGGMYSYLGSPTVSNLIFTNNYAEFGGGMFNGGEFDFEELASYPVLTNVIFQNNSATEGGGFFSENYVHVTLTDVTFDGNTASRAGAGMQDRLGSVHLTNVEFKNNVSAGAAGGIQILSLDASLTNVTFSGNTAVWGGGVINAYVNSRLTNVTFSDNTAEVGGGMWNSQASPMLIDVVFTGNSAVEYGGGMYNEANSSPGLTNVLFTNNSAGSGSGMFNDNSSPDLLNVTFSNNTGIPGSRGGAMVNDLNSSPNLTNVTFSNNSVDFIGGAMLNSFDSNPSLENVTFVGNSSTDRGGAIYNWDSNPNLRNVTFSGNSSAVGGALYNDNDSNPIVVNSIMYANTGGEIHNEVGSAVVTYSIVAGGYPGTGNLNVNPLLGPLQDNGGFTQTMALLFGSPAIDSANDAFCPATDQRGVTRPQGSHCDIGAYEFEGSIATPTFTPSPTITTTHTATFTPTATHTPTRTPKGALTNTPTLTNTPITPTATHSVTPHPPTVTFTPSLTVTATNVVPAPADLVKSFSPISIATGGISRLSVLIFNPNAFALTNSSLADNLPAGMMIANPVNLSNSCGGTVSAVAGGTSLSLSGGTVPAQIGSTPGSCTVAINVTANTPGNLINTIPAGALTTANGVSNSSPASATLSVVPSPATHTATSLPGTATHTPTRTPKGAQTNTPTRTNTPITPTATHTLTPHPPTVTFTPSPTTTATNVVSAPADLVKSFSPLLITSGGISQLSVSIHNPNSIPLTGASLVDNLPAGMTIANPVNVTNLCGGTVTAVSGGTSLSLSGGTVPAQGSCTVAIDVTSNVIGNVTNTIPAGALTTANGVTNADPTAATLTVLPSTSTHTPTRTPKGAPTITPTRTNTPIMPTVTFTPSPTLTPSATATSGSSTFPSTGVLDTFNRANGGIGTNWSGFPAAFAIASNQLDVVTGSVDTYIFWKNTSFGSNQEVHVTLTQIDTGTGNQYNLILKSQSNKSTTSGLLAVKYDTVNHIVQVGTFHPTQGWATHGANLPVTFVNGDQFGARARADGTVEIYKNGVLIGTRSITSWPYYSNGGYIGLWAPNSPNAILDDFGGGTVIP